MAQSYTTSQQQIQDRFDTRRLADRLSESTTETVSEAHRAFIEARDMFFIATADADGWPQVSYKGGDPGFVRVVDDRTLVFPVYNGNGMFLTSGNISENAKVGLLFIDWEVGTRLKVNGEASVSMDDPLTSTWPGALFVVRVTTREVFAQCRRYVHRQQGVEASPFVPGPEGDAPVPDWKLDPWFDGYLPADDPALDPDHPSAASIPQF
jgi:hypothetical protein